MAKVFVYGTLKRGQSAHEIMADCLAQFLGEATTAPKYRLYDQGGYPGMVSDNAGRQIHGELFEVHESSFKILDRYECVDAGLFRREQILLSDGRQAWAYLFNRPLKGQPEFESGVWVEP